MVLGCAAFSLCWINYPMACRRHQPHIGSPSTGQKAHHSNSCPEQILAIRPVPLSYSLYWADSSVHLFLSVLAVTHHIQEHQSSMAVIKLDRLVDSPHRVSYCESLLFYHIVTYICIWDTSCGCFAAIVGITSQPKNVKMDQFGKRTQFACTFWIPFNQRNLNMCVPIFLPTCFDAILSSHVSRVHSFPRTGSIIYYIISRID